MLSTDRLLVELTAHTRAFAAAVAAADPGTPVATCPEWTVRDLAAHLGGVHRWAAAHVAERRAKLERRGPGEPPPESPHDLAAWLTDGADAVVDAVRTVGDDTEVGGFGGPVTVRFWARRQCHETLVHRGDAEIAAGLTPWIDVAADVAADGVDEHLDLVVLGARHRTALHGSGETVHLHASDTEPGEWLVTRESDDLRLERRHAKADVALRGGATTLLGVVTGRLASDRGEVLGDHDLLEHWLTHAVV